MNGEPTIADLREAMAAHTKGVQPAPDLGRTVRARVSRQRRAGAGAIALAVLTAGSLTVAGALPGGGHSPAPGTPATAATSAPSNPPVAVLNYRQVCDAEGSVCPGRADSPDPLAGNVPSALLRPLHFPTVATGQPCPATPGTRLDTSVFGGVALGTGPVQPLLEALEADATRGIADLLNPTSSPPWLGFNTLWVSRPSYQGPFIVRAQRLDGAGTVLQGAGPNVPTLVIPPGPTINSDQGWRTAPGGTWVNTPGCYAWQVDGLTFSYVIVVNAVLRPQP